ncbi:MAG: lipoprotein insertase outer membrane protein LolB [Buchnera aphidicola (Melaphis rhois)]
MRFKHFFFTTIFCLLHASCSINISNTLKYKLTWENQKNALKKIKEFQINGYLLCFSRKTKIFSWFLFKQYSPQHYAITFINPIGQIQLKVVFYKNIFKITDNEGKMYINQQPEITLFKAIGLKIPLNSFNKWMIGLPEKTQKYSLKDHTYVSELQCFYKKKLWKITYSHHKNKKTLPLLPNWIKIKQENGFIIFNINKWILK